MRNQEAYERYQKNYRIVNREEINRKNRERCRNNRIENSKRHKEYNDSHKEMTRNRELLIKIKVLTHYGNNRCACVRCGYDNIKALSIDHINGGGVKHRKDENIHGVGIYRWLLNHNLPEGYQTLCMNCQFIKRAENKEASVLC
jgi:hypothetical protein